jgi:hypothetical protein
MGLRHNTARLATVDTTKIVMWVTGLTIPWAVIILVARQLVATFN